LKRLGDLERAVMDVLWNAGQPATVREVVTALADRGLAYTTVMTVLDRLTRKELVRRQPAGRAWRYSPVRTRDAYVAELMLEALDLTGDRDAALVHFAQSVSGPDADVLRDALTEQAAESPGRVESPGRPGSSERPDR